MATENTSASVHSPQLEPEQTAQPQHALTAATQIDAGPEAQQAIEADDVSSTPLRNHIIFQ
jgi:hypothetical protein